MVNASNLKVAVLLGGFSAERDVSLRSGKAAATALRSIGVTVEEVDVKDENFTLPSGIQAAFLALHGTGGEDGVVQGILERQGVIFTGSGSEASKLAFDKIEAKKVFRKVGLPTAGDVVFSLSDWEKLKGSVDLKYPRVVKPSCQGSSIGVRIVKNAEEMDGAIQEAFAKDTRVLVEEFISGREFTVGILGERVLPVVEIRPKAGWYDYTNKYTKNATEYLVPAPIDQALEHQLQDLALKAHHSLGCRDLSRSDFLVDAKGNTYLLEVNTIPGMTETSLLPKAAAAAGISFPQVCLTLIEQALNRSNTPS
jgi:D-alanine-D-alanine ligase